MKFLFTLFGLLLFSAASKAFAERIVFQSGEHENFTRLVASLPTADTEWSLHPYGEGYVFRVRDVDTEFAFGDVFSKIPQTRLSSISEMKEPRGVFLSLACDCEISAKQYEKTFVILDIMERQEPAALPFEFGLKRAETTKPQRFQFPQVVLSRSSDLDALRRRALGLDDFPANSDRLKPLERDLLLAVSQTLGVERAVHVEANSSEVGESAVEESKPDGDVNHSISGNHANPEAQIKVHNEVSSETTSGFTAGKASSACLGQDTLNLSNWGESKPLNLAVGPLRNSILGELGDTKTIAAEALAKTYLYYSFGTEARRVLEELPSSRQREAWKELSHIVEGHTEFEGEILSSQRGCGGDGEFWSLMVSRPLALNEVERNSILLTFSSLPNHFKPLLGATLSEKLLSLGEVETAGQVLDVSNRTSVGGKGRLELGRAKVMIAEGDTGGAAAVLDTVVLSGGASQPNAVIEKIALSRHRDMEIDKTTIDLAASYATELRHSDLGQDAGRAYIQALVLAGDYLLAFERLEEEARFSTNEQDAALVSAATKDLSENATAVDFLTVLFRHNLPDKDMALQSRTQMARRLLDLGFSETAQKSLKSATTGFSSETQKLLLAEAALALRRPHRAAAELIGVVHPKADELRAKYFSMIGDHDASYNLHAALGNSVLAEREAWFSEAYEKLEGAKDPLLAASAQLSLQAAKDGNVDSVGPLARAADLLNGSGKVRAHVETILAASARGVEKTSQ